MFNPNADQFQACVIAGLTFACGISDAPTLNRYGPLLAQQWSRVRPEDRSAAVLATLIVDFVYREAWMPVGTAATDWGYHERVLHLAAQVIPLVLETDTLAGDAG